MIIGGIYAPDCALFAVPSLWTIVNTFRSFLLDEWGKIIKRINNERVKRMKATEKKSGERQELDRDNLSNMDESVCSCPNKR